MNSRIRRPALIYEYLPAEDIEALAHALLAEYGAAVEAICGPPVPVEAIVDLAARDKAAIATSVGAGVDRKEHANGGLVDGDPLERLW